MGWTQGDSRVEVNMCDFDQRENQNETEITRGGGGGTVAASDQLTEEEEAGFRQRLLEALATCSLLLTQDA